MKCAAEFLVNLDEELLLFLLSFLFSLLPLDKSINLYEF